MVFVGEGLSSQNFFAIIGGFFLTIVLVFAAKAFFGEDEDQVENFEMRTEGMDLMGYFDPHENDGKNDFIVTDIYLRQENNFLQGLYFDADERAFYESAGLYGKSHVQRLAPQDPQTMSLMILDFFLGDE